MKSIWNEKGFSLVEIIISVSVLALVSGFILKMFVISAEVNQKARDLDVATSIASNTLEIFKSQENFLEFWKERIFEGAEVAVNSDEKEYEITKVFDGDWKDFRGNTGQKEISKKFILEVTVNKKEDLLKGQLFEIRAKFKKIDKNLAEIELLDFQTEKYFDYK